MLLDDYEIAVATTKAYLAQLSIFALITSWLANNKDLLNDLNKTSNLINQVLETNIKDIAKSIYKNNNIFFIGRGIDYALCL